MESAGHSVDLDTLLLGFYVFPPYCIEGHIMATTSDYFYLVHSRTPNLWNGLENTFFTTFYSFIVIPSPWIK